MAAARTGPVEPSGAQQVDEYLAAQSEPQRSTLIELRARLRAVLPDADECIKYGMPSFTVAGKAVAGFAAATHHCGYYPHSSTVLSAAGDAVASYRTSKGALQFPVDEPLPIGLVRELVAIRLAELHD